MGTPRGCWGPLGDIRDVGCIGAGRECRFSGARRGIGGIRGHLGIPRVLGSWSHWGHQGVSGLYWGDWQGV